MTKTCTKCLTEKPLEQFTLNKGTRDGRQSWCRGCTAEYLRNYYRSNPEYRAQCAAGNKRRALARKYNLTAEARTEMAQAQGGCCAICQQPEPLVVDHNHFTDKVRALLCSPCNMAIGLLKDDPRRARVAAAYLEQHRSMPANDNATYQEAA